MWPLVALGLAAAASALLVLQQGHSLLGVVIGSPGLPLANPGMSSLTRSLQLRRSKSHARVFADRGYVPHPVR